VLARRSLAGDLDRFVFLADVACAIGAAWCQFLALKIRLNVDISTAISILSLKMAGQASGCIDFSSGGM